MSYRDHGTSCPRYRHYRPDVPDRDDDPRLKWSAAFPVPSLGSTIRVRINNCGPAVVTGYFEEAGWLGVKCRLLEAPDWHKKQNDGDPNGHAFGAEISLFDDNEGVRDGTNRAA